MDIFNQADIFDNDVPCLVVGPAFMAELGEEIRVSCHKLPVKVVMCGPGELLTMNRNQLLKQTRSDVLPHAVIPLKTIKALRPIKRDDCVYVPAEEQLPPFFRVPWQITSVFVRYDIHQRIEVKIRGAEFNLTATL